MSQKTVDAWTTEDVHRWLTTEVKVHQSCADIFSEEDVLGEYLVSFQKTDILDLGIKHGPAVKITCYLDSLKRGSKHQSGCPAYVEDWTKEQVSEWLLQHLKVYSKYAERLQEEDVSGDCLVCFKKQDLVDVGVKHGPAIKILAELQQLNQKPEPRLQPALHSSSERGRAEPRPPPSSAGNHPAASKDDRQPSKGDASHPRPAERQQRGAAPASGASGTRRKDAAAAEAGADSLQITVVIQNILDELRKDDLKRFRFHLSGFSKSKHKGIPQGRLENKDSLDTAALMTDHYGGEEALRVTADVLKDIDQRQLACQLERTVGLQRRQVTSQEAKKDTNQGDKLKNLLTCGGNSLDSYDRFVVVVNRSLPQHLQNLQFLTKLKLFCVLDFDCNSAASGGLCHSYRALRGANLHTPSHFQGKMESVIKNLNLYRQTSWVFCNGRHDLDSDANKELDYKTWLRKSCRDVEHLVSFICNPEVLLRGRYLIIFLLLSPVESEKDPVFDTYKAFIKHTEEENIITICESHSLYLKWRELIREKCDFDVDNLSVSELSLSEINGTVMALGPSSQPAGRLLPSSGSSAVVLKQKDEDLLTALDVLCLNQCENIYDENSAEFHDFRKTAEEEFYRGGKVTWWNFYFCDKDKEKLFVKREKYDAVKKMIRAQSNANNICVLLNLFHDPGCGGTTLAMHVMWDLRQEFRCAVLKDNTLPKSEVAVQIQRLMKLEGEKPSAVLLLVDDTKETENHHDLVNCIRQAVEDLSDFSGNDSANCKVIILNCVRSHSPKDQYRAHNDGLSQFITASLTPGEQRDFEKKFKELEETYEKHENFYSFMFMKKNFDKAYATDLAHNTLESFDMSTREAQLFAFLALLNTYVAKSEIALSLCEDFFGMKMIRWQEDTVLDRMKPYSKFLIIDKVEEWGGYKGIRILHHTLASACVEELKRSYRLNVSDVTMQLLHYDLFFSAGVVKHRLMLLIQRMLIERQRKKDGDDREPFSPLIHKIHSQQGRQMVQEIFMKASSRFETSASIPQALARYLYINERDFPEALKWAETAKKIKENPYTFDTIGQVHKSNLRTNMDREKQEPTQDPEDLQTNIMLAINGMKAFQRAQDLAEREDEPLKESADDDSEDYPRKSYNVYGYVGMLEIAFLVFEILSRLPFFKEHDPMKKKYLQSFLRGSIPITSVNKESSETNDRFTEIIKVHEPFLVKLKSEVKEIFDFLDCYFAYIKRNSEFDTMKRRTVCELFRKYVHLFCTSTEEMKKEQENKSNLNLKLDIEQRKVFLEKKQADTFSGILQYLDKHPEEMEEITECYTFLQKKIDHPKQRTQMKINHILSHIVLYHLSPKSKHVRSYRELSALLLETLQDVGLSHPFPDPYYLALLLFWPTPAEESTDIGKYVTAIRKSSHKHLYKLFNKRSTVAHFYLGRAEGLDRLVSKPKLDRSFLSKMPRDTLAQLWRNGDIFKEKAITHCLHRVSGTIEQGEVYANYGKMKIPVHPARISGIRSGFSTEKVSFYLGFAINGPLAYNIKYENQ